MSELSAGAANLMEMLRERELTQYGECYGEALDELIAHGLVEILGAETETQNSFIAKGQGLMYRAVRVTEAGRRS